MDQRDIRQAVIAAFKNGTTEMFKREGYFDPQRGTFRRWRPLTVPYKARKQARGQSSRIGVRTGALRRSLTRSPAVSATPGRIRMGTKLSYAEHFARRRPVYYADAEAYAVAIRRAVLGE